MESGVQLTTKLLKTSGGYSPPSPHAIPHGQLRLRRLRANASTPSSLCTVPYELKCMPLDRLRWSVPRVCHQRSCRFGRIAADCRFRKGQPPEMRLDLPWKV